MSGQFRLALALATGLVVGVCVSGCASDSTKGYAFGSTFDDSIRTVTVPIFGNKSFSRGIEIQLTDAIIKEIHATTPWRVVTGDSDVGGGGGGQASLTGTITGSELDKLSTGRGSGLAQEVSVKLTVDFDFKDNRTGRVLVSRRSFVASESFIPAQGVGERLEAGQHAVVQELARDIVAELRSSW